MNSHIITFRTLPVRLGQFLKYADLAASGSEARRYIAEGSVSVNGEKERRRGRRLVEGDVVEFAGRKLQVGHQ